MTRVSFPESDVYQAVLGGWRGLGWLVAHRTEIFPDPQSVKHRIDCGVVLEQCLRDKLLLKLVLGKVCREISSYH